MDPQLIGVNTAARGLPRPLAADRSGVLRPVPYSQSDDTWGLIDEGRLHEAEHESRCLVCGEVVESGVVIWVTDPSQASKAGDDPSGDNFRSAVASVYPPRPAPEVVTFETLPEIRGYVADGGPMHDRCGKMARCHCQFIRTRFHSGVYVFVPYRQHADTAA